MIDDSHDRRTYNQGRYYWCVGVLESISDIGEIYLMADDVSVSAVGALVFTGHFKRRDRDDTGEAEGNSHANLVLAPGTWSYCFAASVMDGSATCVEYWPGQVSPRTRQEKKPSGKGRPAVPNHLRMQVFQRDGFRCRACGRQSPDVTIHVDHIKPVAKGGKTILENLQTLCNDCNQGKADKMPGES